MRLMITLNKGVNMSYKLLGNKFSGMSYEYLVMRHLYALRLFINRFFGMSYSYLVTGYWYG